MGKVGQFWVGIFRSKLIPTTEEQKSILELFDCGYLVEGSYLRSIGIGRI